jgi:Domain of unknown function (DUF6532)
MFLTLNAVSARAIKEDMKSKTGLGRSKQAKDFNQLTKEILDLAKVTFTHVPLSKLSLTVFQEAKDNGIEGIVGQKLRPGASTASLGYRALSPISVRSQGSFGFSRHSRSSLQLQLPNTGSNPWMLSASIKRKIAPHVTTMYHFIRGATPDSVSGNARRAKILLTDKKFIYRVCHSPSRFATSRILTFSKQEDQNDGNRPYSHPIIQKAINVSWFRDKNDVGIMNLGHFSPMPVSAIALILTAVNTLIDVILDNTEDETCCL